jgi:uncharacterized protein
MNIPKTLEVVVKITERCNINCSYCYMFNKGNEEFRSRPAYMPEKTVLDVAKFLAEAASTHSLEQLRIVFHGGEPMMMKPERFERTCEHLEEWISPHTHLALVMQTNAMLVSDRWLSALVRHSVGVGVSIDGPQEYHDIDRIDHKGGPTYPQVVAGLRRLQQAGEDGLLVPLGSISVINPQFDGRKVFEHLVCELGLKNLSFLLPIDTYESFNHHGQIEGYGLYMQDIYKAWIELGDPGVRVRFIDEMLSFMRGGRQAVERQRSQRGTLPFFVIGSNGDLEPDDALKPVDPQVFGRWNVNTIRLEQYLAMPEIVRLLEDTSALPSVCNGCCWQNDCQGSAGRTITRYSSRNGFANRSFLCAAIKSVYSYVASSALKSGLDYDKLIESITPPSGASHQSPSENAPLKPPTPITWLKATSDSNIH